MGIVGLRTAGRNRTTATERSLVTSSSTSSDAPLCGSKNSWHHDVPGVTDGSTCTSYKESLRVKHDVERGVPFTGERN